MYYLRSYEGQKPEVVWSPAISYWLSANQVPLLLNTFPSKGGAAFHREFTSKELRKVRMFVYVCVNESSILPFVTFKFPFFFKFYLSLAALGLCCCVWAFSSCGERGLLFIVVHGLLTAVASRCRARALGAQASVVAACELSSCSAWAW